MAPEYEESNRVEILVNSSRLMILKNLFNALKTNWDGITRLYAKQRIEKSGTNLSIHLAAAAGLPELVEDWILSSVDVDDVNDIGFTPLLYATVKNAIERVKVLWKYRCNVDASSLGVKPLSRLLKAINLSRLRNCCEIQFQLSRLCHSHRQGSL